MTAGALVRNVFVRIRSDGAAQAKADMAEIAARAKAIGAMNPAVRLSVDDKAALASLAAFRLELAALKQAGDQAGLLNLAARLRDAGAAADAPRVKMSALRLELDAARAAAAGAAGALGGAAGGGFQVGGGLLGSITAALGPMGTAAAAAGVLATGIGGIVPAAVSAGLGLASFGALAFPTIQKLLTNFQALQAAIKSYQDASANLDTAIHASAANWKAYQASVQNVEPGLRSAAQLLTNQNVLWQNLSPAMQANVIALSNNRAQLRLLLPDQKAALDALLNQADAWGNLSPAQQKAAVGLQGLTSEFKKLVAAVAPLTFQVLNDGLKIANTLLPTLLPFAQAAGKALDGLLKGFEGFAKSPGFKQWQSQMLALAGPMITTLGEGLGKIVIAVGKLLIAMSNPEALRSFKYLLDAIAFTITALAWVFVNGTRLIVVSLHGIAVGFDHVRRTIAENAHQIAHTFDDLRHAQAIWWHDIAFAFDAVRHAAASLAHDIAHYFDDARHTIATWANDVGHYVTVAVNWWRSLPGRIRAALGDLSHLLWNAGVSIMNGFLGGLQSKWHSVTSFVDSVAGWISSHKGPLEADAVLLRPHGQVIMGGLIAGMQSRMPDLTAQMARTTAAISGGVHGSMAPGHGGGYGAAGAGGGWIEAKLVVEPGGDRLMREIADGMKLYVRVNGGGGPGSVQRALGWNG